MTGTGCGQRGNGDICNQGVHEMDVCLWALGKTELAPRVMSLGGRFGYDDDGETSNTMVSFLDYKPVPIIFEVRGLPKRQKTPGKAMDKLSWCSSRKYHPL